MPIWHDVGFRWVMGFLDKSIKNISLSFILELARNMRISVCPGRCQGRVPPDRRRDIQITREECS